MIVRGPPHVKGNVNALVGERKSKLQMSGSDGSDRGEGTKQKKKKKRNLFRSRVFGTRFRFFFERVACNNAAGASDVYYTNSTKHFLSRVFSKGFFFLTTSQRFSTTRGRLTRHWHKSRRARGRAGRDMPYKVKYNQVTRGFAEI